MDIKQIRSSIANTVKGQGNRLKRATPSVIAVAIVSASLLPIITANYTDTSPLLSLLSKLGVATLTDYVVDFVKRLRKKYGKKKPKPADIQEQLEAELLEIWNSGGENAANLRVDTSVLLKSFQGINVAISASTGDLKQALTKGFGNLGGEFKEFRWILDELKEDLEEIRLHQSMQLATQKEQLDIQREQLTKTNLILKIQRDREKSASDESAIVEMGDLPPADLPNPYKGLASFQPQDAEDFFGREELVAELLSRLAESDFLGVVGPSGSGKSSVVRAGIIPSIWEGEVAGSKHWNTVIMTPGSNPLEELAVRVAIQSGISANSLLTDLKNDPKSLRLAIKQSLADQPVEAKLVFVIDQFEELFTLCKSKEVREAYISALMSAVVEGDSKALVIIVLRANFYGRCAIYSEFAALLSDNQVLVGPMTEIQLRAAIADPAKRVGLKLEPGLIEMVVSEVSDEPGALPMMSHSLMETWKNRNGNTLTVQGYLDSGGVSGAIAQTAETVFRNFTKDKKIIAKNIFLRLTEIGDGVEATSRRADLDELGSDAGQEKYTKEVLKDLADARLIITSQESAELAHEAIFEKWPTMRAWLEDDRESLQIHRHLTQAAHQWEKAGHDLDDLYRGARLHQSEEWAKENGAEMNALESDFLKASKNEVLKQHKVNRRRRVVIAGALGLALVVTTLGITGQLNRYFFQPVDMDDYWIEIPAGEFIMGSEDADGDEAPIHTVSLDTYWIGRYEITNMQYAQCEKSGECLGRGSSVASSSHPAVNVSWNDAQTYCEWVGGSLPTEAQWEKAARGTDGRTYPWESEGIDESLANIDANIGDTTPVGSYPKGASPYGALDMAGNVWEWVADWYANDYYASSPNENPAGPQHGTFRVLRGGAWYNGSGNVRAADRYYESMTLSYFGNGFRCAASVQP